MSIDTPRIAAIVHVYYPGFWDELARCLRNINDPFDLFVTVRSDSVGDAICGKIKEDFPCARISRPENVGYDIWPFLSVVNDIDLSAYDIVIKLHTKRDMRPLTIINKVDMSGAKWRRYLMSFVNTDKAWTKTKKRLMRHDTGAVSALEPIISYRQTPRPGRGSYRRALLLAYHILHKRPPRHYQYVAGTMFAIKASLLKPLHGVFYSRDFEVADESHTEGLAHTIERLFGLLVATSGFRLVPWRGSVKMLRLKHALMRHTGDYFYQRKEKKNGDVIYKILRIPVWRTYVTQP